MAARLLHPRTGEPIRPIYISPRTGRIYWPILGGDETGATGATGATGPAGATGATGATGADPGFPANTPLEQMNAEQREAYWKDKARKHEDRNKALGNLTPEKLAELQEKATKHDALEAELGTTADKAAAKAAEEAKAEARGELQPALIRARLDAAAARAGVSEEDLAKAVEFVDTSKFLAADGTVDTDKVKAFVATIAPATGNQNGGRKGPTVTGHGSGTNGGGGSGLSGLSGDELYDRLHPKPKATA